MRIEEAIVSRLIADSAVSALVSNRVYHMQMPQHVTMPCITYQRISTSQGEILDGEDTRTDVRIQVDAWAGSTGVSKSLALAVRRSLSGFRGLMGDVLVQRTKFESELDLADIDGDERIRRVTMDFIFTLHE